MRRVLLLAVVVLALGASEAQAHTTIVGPPIYQRWVDEAKVPTPNVVLAVAIGETDRACYQAGVEHAACTDPEGGMIWLSLAATGERYTFLHEIGHNVDAFMLHDADRAAFMAIYGLAGAWTTGPGPASPNEVFADVWAECAVKPYLTRRAMHTLGAGPIFGGPPRGGRVRHNRACRLLATPR